MIDSEPGAALVLTVESTQISACSSGSLISKGKFEGQSLLLLAIVMLVIRRCLDDVFWSSGQCA